MSVVQGVPYFTGTYNLGSICDIVCQALSEEIARGEIDDIKIISGGI